GTDLAPQFLFQATDRDGDHAEGRFTVTVVDDAPEPGSRDIEVDEDGSVTINTSADGNPDNTLVTAGPQYGTATVGPDGSITYTPAYNYSGEDSFTYEITGEDGSTVTITVHVTVNPV